MTVGAQGRYAAAYALLEPLSVATDPVLASLACSTIGSHRRQLGGHHAARRWDALAARHAARARSDGVGTDPDGIGPTGALADALLGLAADALAVGRLAEAAALVDRAAAPARGSWRTRVRHAWVSAELVLASGRASAAVAPAERAAALAPSRTRRGPPRREVGHRPRRRTGHGRVGRGAGPAPGPAGTGGDGRGGLALALLAGGTGGSGRLRRCRGRAVGGLAPPPGRRSSAQSVTGRGCRRTAHRRALTVGTKCRQTSRSRPNEDIWGTILCKIGHQIVSRSAQKRPIGGYETSPGCRTA